MERWHAGRSLRAGSGSRVGAVALGLLLALPFAATASLAAPAPLALSGVHLSVSPAGIAFSSGYVLAGDHVWVNTTVQSVGDMGANATLQLFAGDPLATAPFASQPFAIGPNASTSLSSQLDTTGLEGIREVTARIVSIAPAEAPGPSDNEAAARLRVHTVADQLWQGTAAGVIGTSYNQTGFVTVRDSASLTLAPGGSLVMQQGHDGEFDVLVEDNGQLRIDGGVLSSPFALTVELAGNASLAVGGNGELVGSVRSSSGGTITVTDASVFAKEFDVAGGSTLLDGANLSVGQATFAAGSLTVVGSQLLGPVSILAGVAANFTASTVSVERRFDGAAQADTAYPGVSAYLSAGAAPYQPAVQLTGASSANFAETSVSSVIWVGAQPVTSTVPVLADGGATATIWRIARVAVTDPIGAPVRNATVEVWDYFDTAIVTSAVAVNGTLDVPLKADLLSSGRANAVGHYHVVAWRAATRAAAVPLLFRLYPDLSAGSLVQDVPVVLALFAPWGLYAEDVPAVTLNESRIQGERVFASSVEVHTPLALEGANVTLLQSHPFERYIVVTDNGSLASQASSIRSAFPFDLYVLNQTSASFNDSALINGNLLVSGAGNISLRGARIVGSAIGDAATFACDGSYLWGRLVEVDAGSVRASDCVMAASELVALGGGPVTLASVGLGATFEPFDAANRSSLPFASFDALAGSDLATPSSSPAVRLAASALDATGLTVWTGAGLTFSLGADNSTVAGARLLAGSAAFALTASNLSVRDSLIDPRASAGYTGSGEVELRAVASPTPSIAEGVTLDVFDPVTATVTDAVDLPVEGALVTAVPQGSPRAVESALSDANGEARLLLLVSSTVAGVTARGPVYRINATRGGEASATVSWDASLAGAIAFSLPSTFSSVGGEASFALIAVLQGGLYRVLSTNLPNGSLASFLLSFNTSAAALDFTSAVFPGQSATLFVAADYDYRSGSASSSRPMAGESGALEVEGAPVANFTLDSDGLASVALSLPGASGLLGINVTVSASKLGSGLRYPGSMEVTPLPTLVVDASLSKRAVKPSFELIVVGTVRDQTGLPVAGATVAVTYGAAAATRTVKTGADGSFLVKFVAPSDTGNYTVRVVASRANSLDSQPAVFPFTVSTTAGAAPPPAAGAGPNFLVLGLGGIVFVGSAAGLVFAWTQRRIARGEFVVCGNCEKPTLAADRKCRNCGVEFEATVAKCSKCGSWIAPDAAQCPQCHTEFVRRAERVEAKEAFAVPVPTAGVPAGYDIPEAVPLTGKKLGPARLEDMEFRLPGTTDTLELADQGGAPSFAAWPPGPSTQVPTARASGEKGAERPLERMELPRHEDPESHVREVSAMEGGEPPAKEPVSLGTGNMDLSRTTAAATSTKSDPKPDEQVPEDVLRELLMKAAPELTGQMLPGDIRRELAEIARSEAPVASEKKAAVPPRGPVRGPGALPPEERPAEAPEKSRKTAFDVFATPAKNIPAGYERKGGPAQKEGAGKAAPVCPNCGGNWVVQRDGKNSCRVCGTRW